MEKSWGNMIFYGIDTAGFDNELKCGTINYFDGWVVGAEKRNPPIGVRFSVDGKELGVLALEKERPDLENKNGAVCPGFCGVIPISDQYFGKLLRLEAIMKNGTLEPVTEYLLSDRISEDVKRYGVLHGLPDDVLMYLVANKTDPQAFLEGGRVGVELINGLLKRHGIDMTDFEDVLDFGVGCGRVFRWWRDCSDKVRFWGTDINPLLIDWCKENLDFGHFSINYLQPPSGLPKSRFDLIYAFSVFTHLDPATQKKWLSEFSRILKTEGLLMVSVHGDGHAASLPEPAYRLYKDSGFCVLSKSAEGRNLCASYQSEAFSKALFTKRFDLLDFLPGALLCCGNQDLYLLRKKPGPLRSIPFIRKIE